ncbi:MAG: flagellar FliJ protein [Planctomycetota bacterium]
MKRDPKKLSRILRVRQLQEESARGVWIQAQLAARQADACVVESQQNLELSQEFIRGQQAQGSISGVLNADAAMVHQLYALAETKAQAAARHRDVEAAKAPWVETRRAARGMEKLVERAQEDQRIERLQKEDQSLESSLEALLVRQKNQQPPLSA